MRLANIMRILGGLGLLGGCGMGAILKAQVPVHIDDPIAQLPLNLSGAPTVRAQAELLSSIAKSEAASVMMRIPTGSAPAGMLKFAARGNAWQVLTAQAAAVMASATAQCTTLTYDKNGNRLSQTVTSIAASPVAWGGGMYGCFVWAP